MKILGVNESKEQRGDNKLMDLLNVDVSYPNGSIGRIYIYRANLNALLKKQELIKKYGISEKEMDDFIDLVRAGYDANHYYDEED